VRWSSVTRSDLFRGWCGCFSLVLYSDRSGSTLQCWPSPPPSPCYAIRLHIYSFFCHLQNQILCMMSTLVWSDCVSSHCTLVDGMIRVIISSPVAWFAQIGGPVCTSLCSITRSSSDVEGFVQSHSRTSLTTFLLLKDLESFDHFSCADWILCISWIEIPWSFVQFLRFCIATTSTELS